MSKKYIVEVRLPKDGERFISAVTQGVCSIKDFDEKRPVILLEIEPTDMGESINILTAKIVKLEKQIEETEGEMLESVYSNNTNRIIQLQSAISILAKLNAGSGNNTNNFNGINLINDK